MVNTKILENFYIEQYEDRALARKGRSRHSDNLGERISRLQKTLHSAVPSRTGFAALESYHRQIGALFEDSMKRGSQKVIAALKERLVPDLVRLDVGMLFPEQRSGITEEFLAWLRKKRHGAICTRPLFVLYPAYKEEVIREKMTDLVPTRPEMEFPDALDMNRRFILHIGPTNSGKTFQALERLKKAKHGIYLGPLRLLALEVYEKMHDAGVPSMMLTGQECIEDPDSVVTAATVEMADLDQFYDIAVIDEAQMMADRDRGHSWTRAILGLKANEIHICASANAEKVIRHLIDLCHDTCEINYYKRKTRLVFEEDPFSFPDDIEQGDALIVFSKKSVLDVAGRLEEAGIESSVIYGSLPPEIRRKQMHLFTDGVTKVVVSTDAIGMGLNLPVRRIIFLQCSKYDGVQQRLLSSAEIRQIAGRAGRFGIYDTGYVTAADQESLDYLRYAVRWDDPEVTRVSLGFPQVLLDIHEPLDEILKVWHSQTPIEPFEKENVDEMLFLYEKARTVRSRIVGFEDKRLLYRMISTPIDIKDRQVVNLWIRYCTDYTADVCLEKPRISRAENALMKYETYYKQLDLYYQMSYRLGKEIDLKWLAMERSKTEDMIMRYLLKDKANYIKRCRFCGRLLPIDSPFNCCEDCFSRQNTWR